MGFFMRHLANSTTVHGWMDEQEQHQSNQAASLSPLVSDSD